MTTKSRSTAFTLAILTLSALVLDGLPIFVQAQSAAASEAATQIARAKLEAATAAQNAGKKKWPVTREDIVVAMPVDQAHLTVAHASRVWRKVFSLLCLAVKFRLTLSQPMSSSASHSAEVTLLLKSIKPCCILLALVSILRC